MDSNPPDFRSLRNELADLVKRRKEIGDNLENLERQIYAFEGSYLEDTHSHGNIVQGWEGYLNPARILAKGEKQQFRKKFRDSDRIFSRSSITGIPAPTANGVGEVSAAAENREPPAEEKEGEPVSRKSGEHHGHALRRGASSKPEKSSVPSSKQTKKSKSSSTSSSLSKKARSKF